MTARRLLAGLRFKRDRYLLPEVRTQVIDWLVVRLEDGWSEDYLGRRLGEWAEQAGNPSTYLPMQLEALGQPRPRLTVVPDPEPARPHASDDHRARVMARIRATTKPGRRRFDAADTAGRDPRRALDDLDDLLRPNQDPANGPEIATERSTGTDQNARPR